jgi:hypothetical protein
VHARGKPVKEKMGEHTGKKEETMPDIWKELETLSDEELEALIARAEAILRQRVRSTPLAEDPAIGMWKDREDMHDSAAWVHEMRQHEWRHRD